MPLLISQMLASMKIALTKQKLAECTLLAATIQASFIMNKKVYIVYIREITLIGFVSHLLSNQVKFLDLLGILIP